MGVGVSSSPVSPDFNKSISDTKEGKENSNVLFQDINTRQTDRQTDVSQKVMDDLMVIRQTQGTLNANSMHLR
jgi:hypothetical protein